jgi:hypothetical protein
LRLARHGARAQNATAFSKVGMTLDADLAAASLLKHKFDRICADGVLVAGMHLYFLVCLGLARPGDA